MTVHICLFSDMRARKRGRGRAKEGRAHVHVIRGWERRYLGQWNMADRKGRRIMTSGKGSPLSEENENIAVVCNRLKADNIKTCSHLTH